MYQEKAVHPFSRDSSSCTAFVEESLWSLFVAIGPHWKLGDDPGLYRLRFVTFIQNRVEIDPLYKDYYREGAATIDELVREIGPDAAFKRILADKPRIAPAGIPATPLEALQRFVANEFIALRLALGSFRSFGAINYCGYFGGANIAGEPTPYRVRDAS